ncbi:tetratricopeptide repeat protein [Actinomadura scrupuli]|uniref:tetratricopeptide repeat protein n=1 Tax=Actinomadura scrupuli TaxID=559629 RepID=UPI003D97A32D
MLSAFKVTNAWAVSGASLGVAVLGAGVTAAWQEQYKKAAQRRDEQELQIEGGCLVLPGGKLPRVSEVTDPIRLGVHPAMPAIAVSPEDAGRQAAERVPVYVPRDIDEQLREHVARGGFVLLVGDSTAGKSRAAYEAMTALPDHVLIAPNDRTALPAAIAEAVTTRRCVLWLNDLENFLGANGLTRAHVMRVLAGESSHRVILATLRAAEEDRFTSEPASEDGGRQSRKDAREALEQAYRISLPRLFSPAEQDRARARDWDPRISDALTRADEYGIAEYLAAAPELLRDWENAWSPNTDPHTPSHPRAAALIAAAIDVRRAGHTSSVSRALLETVHTAYLNERGGGRLRPESIEEAWAWATQPRRATTALLLPHDDGLRIQVFDYLVDSVQRRSAAGDHVPEPLIRAVLADCRPDDANNIADTARDQGRYSIAEAACRMVYRKRATSLGAEHPQTLTSRNNLATALQSLGRFKEAAAESQAVLEAQTRVLGVEHPDTLTTQHEVARIAMNLGRYAEAEQVFREVLAMRERVLGVEHPDTLTTRHEVARMAGILGRYAEAERGYREVLAMRERVLGIEHPDTLVARHQVARAAGNLGRHSEAEQGYREVLAMRERVLGVEHPDTLTTRHEVARMTANLGRYAEAEQVFREVLAIKERTLGVEHPHTLFPRHEVARMAGEQGRYSEAEQVFREVLAIRERVLGVEHPDTLTTRHEVARMTANLGRYAEAEQIFREVLAMRERILGVEHPDTSTTRQQLANVREHLRQDAEADQPD